MDRFSHPQSCGLSIYEAALAVPGLRPAAGFNRITYTNQLKKKKKPLRALAKQAILNFSYF